jgi:N-acetylneuraminic acid mutarotase
MRCRNWIVALLAGILGTPLVMAAEKPLSKENEAAAKAAAEKSSPAKPAAPAGDLPSLPDGISSFGGAVDGDWLYVYGGHIGTAHQHSKQNLSKHFVRLRLDAPSEWETLPAGPGLQGLPMVGYDGGVYRVGGLSARNEQGEDSDLVSVADVVRFDSKSKKWTAVKPLPEGRSSHDAVVADGKLYVVGGWTLGGKAAEEKWLKTAWVLDLAKADAEWQALPEQPFERRALSAAVHGGKLYAIGGMTPMGPSVDVHALDLKTGKWEAAPAIPLSDKIKTMNGFGSSAYAADGKLLLSTMDGNVFRLSADGKAWDKIGELEIARFFHRLLPDGKGGWLAVAGASHEYGHLDSVERVKLDEKK